MDQNVSSIETIDSSTPVFTKKDFQVTESFVKGGTHKRIVKANLLNPDGSVKEKAVLKFMRAAVATGIKEKHEPILISLSDREKELNQAVATTQMLSGEIPTHVPKYLGRYQGLQRAEVFEQVVGSPIGDKMGAIITMPTEEQLKRFRSAIESLIVKRLYPSFDSLMADNLLIGTTTTIPTPEVILAESEVIDCRDIDDPKDEKRYNAEFYAKRALDILDEKFKPKKS